MGYTTNFSGVLKFTNELSAGQLAYLNSILGEDRRDHPEWNASDEFYYIDLTLTPEFDGLSWSGAEKSYGMTVQVNTIIRLMKERWEDFGLVGQFDAQGEEIGDVWRLVASGDVAKKVDLILAGPRVTCPHCELEFVLDAEIKEQDNG